MTLVGVFDSQPIADQMFVEENYVTLIIVFINLDHTNVVDSDYIRGCVFNSEARHRTNEAKFTISDVDFTLCTHYIYSHATVDPVKKKVAAIDPNAETSRLGLYDQFYNAKRYHPKISTLLTVGGPGETFNLLFKGLFNREADAHDFALNAVDFLRDKYFDGINLHWDVEPTILGKHWYTRLIMALSKAFRNDVSSSTKLKLAISVQAYVTYISGAYDVGAIKNLLDYVIVLAYLFKTPNVASFCAPLYASTHWNINETLNVNAAIIFWNKQGLSYKKMLLGLSARGNILKLVDYTVDREPGAPVTSDVIKGAVYQFQNGLAYPEVCERYPAALKRYDNVQKVPYLVRAYEFIGYEDTRSLSAKLQYMQNKDLAGVVFNNMDEDDFNGTTHEKILRNIPGKKKCGRGKFPLVSYVKETLAPSLATRAPPTTTTRATSPRPTPNPVTTAQVVTTAKEETTEEYTGHFTFIPGSTSSTTEEVNFTEVPVDKNSRNSSDVVEVEEGRQMHNTEPRGRFSKIIMYAVLGLFTWAVLVTIVICVRRDTNFPGHSGRL